MKNCRAVRGAFPERDNYNLTTFLVLGCWKGLGKHKPISSYLVGFKGTGGEGGIRTPGTRFARTTV